MQNCMFRTVRLFVWIWLKLKQNCDCFRPKKGYTIINEYDDKLPTVTIIKVIRTRENGNTDFKYTLDWRFDESNTPSAEEVFHHVMPPWLMISKDGEDFTEQLHPYIAKGNIIKIHFLNQRFGAGKWTILDTKTFEEVDFPSSGIIIK